MPPPCTTAEVRCAAWAPAFTSSTRPSTRTNYRLGRWARLRIDLGGFYFDLIFALALLGLYALSRWEFLLLIVLFINLDIVRQMLPFVRLDSYWALADVIGLPNIFGQIGPLLRSLVRRPKEERTQAPLLKGWVKAVLVGYIVLILPLMAFLIFLGLKNLPRLALTTWASSFKQVGDWGKAAGTADVLGVVAATVQLIALALPVLGLAVTVLTLDCQALTWFWHWSEGSAPRRTVGALGTVATVALPAMLWLPQPPFGHGKPGPLYAAVLAGPLRPGERGTLPEARGTLFAGSTATPPSPGTLPSGEGSAGTEPATGPAGGATGTNPAPIAVPSSAAPTPAAAAPPVAAPVSGTTVVAPVATAAAGVVPPSVSTAVGVVSSVQTRASTATQPIGTAVSGIATPLATVVARSTQPIVSTATGVATSQVTAVSSQVCLVVTSVTQQISSAVSSVTQHVTSSVAAVTAPLGPTVPPVLS